MPLQAPGALDIDLVVAVGHDFTDAAIGQQGLQRTQPDGFVQHRAAKLGAIDALGQLPILAHQLDQTLLGLCTQHAVAHGRHVPAPQVERLQQRGMQAAPVRQQDERLLQGGVEILATRGAVRGQGGRRRRGHATGAACADADQARADHDLVVGQHRRMGGHAQAIDAGTAKRAQILQHDGAVQARQARMHPAHSPVGDA
ncbi:Uncharacterised protein [Bordetella pertussis]|nr:Uncharacterised protein [Bordetella pertussis]